LSYLELLPDKWEAVALHWKKKHYVDSLKNLRTKKHQFDACVSCPAFRVKIIEMYGGEFVVTSCIFFNKCIKEYPHEIDNKEFE